MQKTQQEVLPTVDGVRQEAAPLHFLRLTGDPLTYANLCLLFGHLDPHRAVTKATQARREKAECRMKNVEMPGKTALGEIRSAESPGKAS